MVLNIVSEQPMLMAEVKENLETLKGKEELNFRAAKTLEHLERFCPLKKKKAEELVAELKKLDIPRLREQHLIKLVDLMPTTDIDVKVVLQSFAVTVTAENLKKIAETIEPYVKPK
jgi:DNA-directed RNA polymerase subunit F